MAKNKTVQASTTQTHVKELTDVEFELQVHRDETSAKINALSDSLVLHQEALAALRLEIMEGFKAMRERADTVENSALRFGSLPPPLSPSTLPMVHDSASSTRATSSAAVVTSSTKSVTQPNNSQPLNLRDPEVILGYAHGYPKGTAPVFATVHDVELSVTDGALERQKGVQIHEKGESSLGKFTVSTASPSTHYFQHSDFALSASTPSSQIPPSLPLGGHPTFLFPQHMSYQGASSHFGPPPYQPYLPHLYSLPPYPYTHFGHHQQTYATTTTHTPQYNYTHHPAPPTPPPNTHLDPSLPSMRQMKLEFTSFGGGDPVEWLNRAEQYFEFFQVPEERKLAVATLHLTDKAADRWHMFRHEFPNSWQGLAELLMREFSAHNLGDYQAALGRMSQSGSVESYMDQFTKLSRRAPGFSAQTLLSFFMEGLKDNIRALVKAQRPTTLYGACELAKLFEARENQLRANSRNALQHRPNPPNGIRGMGAPYMNPMARGQPVNPPRPQAAPLMAGENPGDNRRYTQAEYQERRARNQCFFCDELYRPGHNCRRGQALMVMEVLPEEVIQPALEGGPEEVAENQGEVQEHEVELRAMGDGSSTSTMQLKGLLSKRQIHVLIDSGASHNFITPYLVQATQYHVQTIPPLRVRLASGAIVYTHRMVTVELNLQGFVFSTNFYVIQVSGCEVVLGAIWLKTLGDILWNFETMRMRFAFQGMVYSLQGLTEPQTSIVSCKTMHKLLKKEKEAVLVQVSLHTTSVHNTVVHPEIQSLIQKYQDVFAAPTSLPPARAQDHRIELLPNTPPINVRPYRYPHFQKKEIEKIVQELVDSGVVRPSVSPYSSPVCLVKKKDGSWRLCVDYRALNAVTIKDKYPIPVVDELIDEVHGSIIFSKLDLRSGYHQIRMAEEDIPKTAFRTHTGHYEFLVMAFGLTNAPSTFQSLMNDVLRDLLGDCVLVFFYDILIFSPSLESHLMHLELVFQKLRQHSLKVKASKCTFGSDTVEYLGHVISKEGVAVDPSKIECVKNWPLPATLKELRGFLGLAGYYRKFVKGFGIIARPLTNMLKKDGFHWDEEAVQAFKELKNALVTTLVLAIPDFSKEFSIECDASDLGIGAVLAQDGHPVAFMSKALSQKHLALSVYDKEMLAVVTAVQLWRPYLLGHHFTIFTDHKTIEHFLTQRITTPAQQKWLIKLLGYDYTIKHKAGKLNVASDALSRSVSLNAITGSSQPIHDYLTEMQAACNKDSETSKIIKELQADSNAHKHFRLCNSQLLYKHKVYVPLVDSWREKIMKEFHEGYVGGHAGRSRTYMRLHQHFAWPGVQKDVKKFVAQCNICQQQHYEATKPPGLLQPISIPQTAWSVISMDFIEALPKSEGMTVIWVVIDKLTKVAHFIPLAHPYTAATLAQKFIDEVFRLHGMPTAIISDRDPIFMSLFWDAFFKLQGTQLHKSSAYHPQTDGQTENLNRTLEQYLRCVVGSKPQNWVKALPWAEFWYNTAHHSAINMTPFKALYGYDAPAIAPYIAGSTAVADVDMQLKERDELLSLIKRNLSLAQSRMKNYYDKHHSERIFQVGDWVYLKLQPYKQQSVTSEVFHKLAAKYYGPFLVLERIGEVAYKLQLPASAKIHNVFHVSLLKKKLGHSAVVEGDLPAVKDTTPLHWSPEKVLQARMVKHKGAAATQWLIQWYGTSPEEATWEYAEDIMERFPAFQF